MRRPLAFGAVGLVGLLGACADDADPDVSTPDTSTPGTAISAPAPPSTEPAKPSSAPTTTAATIAPPTIPGTTVTPTTGPSTAPTAPPPTNPGNPTSLPTTAATTAAPTAPPPTEPVPTAGGEGTALVGDESDRITFYVDDTWTDVSGAANAGRPSLAAAPDLGAFSDGWGANGIRISIDADAYARAQGNAAVGMGAEAERFSPDDCETRAFDIVSLPLYGGSSVERPCPDGTTLYQAVLTPNTGAEYFVIVEATTVDEAGATAVRGALETLATS